MFHKMTVVFAFVLTSSCTEGTPGEFPDVSIGIKDADATADSSVQTDTGTPGAGLDIEESVDIDQTEPEIQDDSDSGTKIEIQPDTRSGEDVEADEVEEVADTKNVCVSNLEQAAACWDGVDNDCDGLTDMMGGDTDCTGYCHPADISCLDDNSETEDFCSPLDWKCRNIGCTTDCNDSNACTTDSCVNGQCESAEIENCIPCSDESACAYGVNPKISDYGFYCDFEAGKCAHITDECATDDDCEDGDPCSKNVCSPAYHAGGVLVCGILPPYQYCTKPCVSNVDCYADEMTCQEGICKPTTFSEVKGDGNICEFQNDCETSPWGKVCVWNGIPSSFALCQECSQEDEDGDGIDRGCSEDRPHCYWGLTWPNPQTGYARSVYECDK